MNDDLRFRLFREIAGYNEISSIKNYVVSLKDSEAYKIVSYNIVEARDCKTRKAKALVYAFDNLKFKSRNVKDVFKLETTLNYLALHSFPDYYLNPLAVQPNYRGEINSIGDLYIDYKGSEKTINEIILDEEDKPEVKYIEIKNYINYCQDDINSIIDESLTSLKKTAFTKSDNKLRFFIGYLEAFFFILFNFAMLFFILYPFKDYQNIYMSFSLHNSSSVFAYLFPLITILYDFVFIIFHSYKAKIMEPFNYAKRFLKKNEFKIHQDVIIRSENLYDYLCGAIKNRIVLKNDITDYSMLSSSFIDYNAILNAEKEKTKPTYKTLKNLLFSFTFLEIVMLIIQTIIYIIDMVFSTIL